jgi:hypothetical protein
VKFGTWNNKEEISVGEPMSNELSKEPDKVTVHEPMVTNVQKLIEPRRYLAAASVDQTDACRNPGLPVHFRSSSR